MKYNVKSLSYHVTNFNRAVFTCFNTLSECYSIKVMHFD